MEIDFRLGRIVPCGLEMVSASGRCEWVDEVSGSVAPEAIDDLLGCLALRCFQLGKGGLDRGEVGRVQREIEQPRARYLDHRRYSRVPARSAGRPSPSTGVGIVSGAGLQAIAIECRC